MTQSLYFLAEGSGPGNIFLPMMLAMFGLMYFLIWRPQRQQQKRQDEMRNELTKGDKIVTAGGIHGIVTGTTKTTVSVKVSDGISIKFDRSSISQVLNDKPKEDKDSKSKDNDSEDEEE